MIRAVIFDLDNTLTDFMKMKRAAIDAAVDGMIDAGSAAIRIRVPSHCSMEPSASSCLTFSCTAETYSLWLGQSAFAADRGWAFAAPVPCVCAPLKGRYFPQACWAFLNVGLVGERSLPG